MRFQSLLLLLVGLIASTDGYNQCLVSSHCFLGSANDTSGNSNHGIVNGAQLTTDRNGISNSAYFFDGIDDYIELPTSQYVNNNYTYALWYNPATTPPVGGATALISIGNTGADQFILQSNNPVIGQVSIVSGSYTTTTPPLNCFGSGLPALNTWHHVAYTRSDSIMKFYENGILIDSTIFSPNTPSYNTPVTASIGARHASLQFFHGKIDDVKIFDCALQANAIDSIFKSSCTANCDTVEISQPICIGDSVLLSIVSIKPNAVYQWSTGDTGTSITVNNSGTYSVIATDGCGITADSISIQILNAQSFSLGPDVNRCANGDVVLRPQPILGGSYQWNTGDTLDSLIANVSGVYSLTISGTCSSSSDTVEVRFGSPFLPPFPSDTSICNGQSITLTRPTVFNTIYRWNTNNFNQSTIVDSTSIINLTAYNSCDTISQSIRVAFGEIRDPLLPEDSVVCDDFSVTLDATVPFGTYNWNNGDSIATILVNTPGQYSVVANSNGCVSVDTVNYVRTPDTCGLDCEIIWPNVFTPNGDLINDLFFSTSTCDYTSYSLQIFNRWGQIVFSSKLPGEPWDGTIRGKPASSGIYFYDLDYEHNVVVDNDRVRQAGSFTLSR